ncbi:class I SAM-dependent methyltransferase [Jatrophihabitans fulvus]
MSITEPTADLPDTALDEIKTKHRAVWSLGDYDAVAAEVIPALGRRLADAAGAGAGRTVLDVAAGSGNAALPAARAGAEVTASDLTPPLLAIGRERAEAEGLSLTWRVADAEHLPFADASFDVVMSCVGVMFAPFHQPVADELLRVCRPGGTLALANWTPGGFIGRLFATMKPFVPAPPPGATPGPLWGDEQHVRGLLGDRVTDLDTRRETLRIDRFTSAEQFVTFFRECYGPTIAAFRGLADDPERRAELSTAMLELAREHGADDGPMQWEYLLVTARRA